jgi:hypothetical protein
MVSAQQFLPEQRLADDYELGAIFRSLDEARNERLSSLERMFLDAAVALRGGS